MTTKRRRTKGVGAVYYRKERDCYAAQVDLGTVNGKRVRKTVLGKTEAEVLSKLAHLQREVRKGTITSGPDQTVGEWLDTWHQRARDHRQVEGQHDPELSQHH